jgi:hypothetical protein
MKTGIELIADERQRQIIGEGLDEKHDDEHQKGELANAAACYALSPNGGDAGNFCKKWWPFEWSWFKPSNGPYPKERIKELAKAGALIAAEIDRLNRKYPV